MFDQVNSMLLNLAIALAVTGGSACALAFCILLLQNLWVSVFDPRGAAMVKQILFKIILTGGGFFLVAGVPAMVAAIR